jgi:hypothetical protein
MLYKKDVIAMAKEGLEEEKNIESSFKGIRLKDQTRNATREVRQNLQLFTSFWLF